MVLVAFASLDGSAVLIVSCAIFGGALIFAYSSSTLYHAITNEKAKQIFRQLDHASIYLLIAGTYTPVVLVSIGGSWGWTIFFIIWTTALVGVALKFIYPHRLKKLSVGLYIIMGWFAVVAAKELMQGIDSGGLWLLLIGGLFYTTGVIFYARKSLPYNHVIWHLFVLAGSISHYFMVLLYII